MVTASHNPVQDNGVKIVDPSGEMLVQSLEPIATDLACCSSAEQLIAVLSLMLGNKPLPIAEASSSTLHRPRPCVLIGFDTRPSAAVLVAAARAGVEALGCRAVLCGMVTTPQLHFLVHHGNAAQSPTDTPSPSPNPHVTDSSNAANTHPSSSPPPSLDSYFTALVGAFTELWTSDSTALPSAGLPPLHVDCANGVGALHMDTLSRLVQPLGLSLRLHNSASVLTLAAANSRGAAGGGSDSHLTAAQTGSSEPSTGQLNHLCGADFVQKEKALPAGMQGSIGDGEEVSKARFCSVDGDADRLVYFAPCSGATPTTRVALLDGDKILVLVAIFIRDLLQQLPEGAAADVQVCCVQTAYANGASTAYLTEVLALPLLCTPTGVKHLHAAAHGADIGIYFEANGHGTLLLSRPFLARMAMLADTNVAARELQLLAVMVNQCVGDALSIILLVELILRRKRWGMSEWQALYTDRPSKQVKLVVADRSVITTTDAERRCVTPPGLQAAIDAAVADCPNGRAFVRPSGTEDAVRVYAEAPTEQAVSALALAVCRVVHDLAGGVGIRP
ncbi:MAG: hypothetical protein WDW36_006811 [Sanguina aurantia]